MKRWLLARVGLANPYRWVWGQVLAIGAMATIWGLVVLVRWAL